METWKDIPGYKGRYQISNLGRVKSLSRNNYRNDYFDLPYYELKKERKFNNRVLKERILKIDNHTGVPYVKLFKNGICYQHRLEDLL